MPLLFAFTLFVSAALLFVVQPMVAKLLLPLLGGAPAVWTTCMVFYQCTLLLGYLYAHVISRRLPKLGQVALQLILLIAAFLTLPFVISNSTMASLQSGAAPIGWLLLTLVAVVGLPFFVVSTTGPLLQRWFSRIQHRDSADPYFLYSASNVGSLLALGAYPIWLEVSFDLATQASLWRAGFGGLIVLVGTCGIVLLQQRATSNPAAYAIIAADPVTWRRRGFWVLLAFVPSSLMLGVTTYLTTDIASIPLLWVLPLMLYLLTFVLVFARREWLPKKLVHRVFPIVTIILVFTLLCRATEPIWFLIAIHLLFFFTVSMVCHGRLATNRPAPTQLTEFYLWMSIGGALGGLFNGVLAPQMFRDVYEYPLIIAVAAALYVGLPPPASQPRVQWSCAGCRPSASACWR